MVCMLIFAMYEIIRFFFSVYGDQLGVITSVNQICLSSLVKGPC